MRDPDGLLFEIAIALMGSQFCIRISALLIYLCMGSIKLYGTHGERGQTPYLGYSLTIRGIPDSDPASVVICTICPLWNSGGGKCPICTSLKANARYVRIV